MKWNTGLLLLVVFACGLVSGCARGSGRLEIREAWARPGTAGETSAVYFTIENGQAEADTLTGAATGAAMVAEVHLSQMDAEGIMTMEHQESVPIPAGEMVRFEPGGLHVMLMNLNDDLQVGEKVLVTLTFEKAGEIQVEATVKEP